MRYVPTSERSGYSGTYESYIIWCYLCSNCLFPPYSTHLVLQLATAVICKSFLAAFIHYSGLLKYLVQLVRDRTERAFKQDIPLRVLGMGSAAQVCGQRLAPASPCGCARRVTLIAASVEPTAS